jgi:hypothetical protein
MNPAAGTAFATVITLSAGSIAENAAAGSLVGTFATTQSGSVGGFEYTLVPGDGGVDNADFMIEDGRLHTTRAFNFEVNPIRSIRVRSTDSAGQAFEQSFVIRVGDVNERPGQATLSESGVTENMPLGTFVGMLAATDPDFGDRVTFALVSGAGAIDNAAFTIVGNELRTASGLDFEAGSTRSVRVRATDTRGRSREAAFTITVANVKEAPAITLPAGGFQAVEDVRGPLLFNAAPFGTSDARPNKRVTVTLAVPRGAIKAESAAGVIVGGTPQAATFFGTLADLNRYFTDPAGLIVYRPRANDFGSLAMSVTVIENTVWGPMQSTAASTITVAPVNDRPVVQAPAEFTVVEDVRGSLSWAGIALPFADVESPTLTVTLAVDDGTVDAVSDAGVTVGGTATARTFMGPTAALNGYFRSLGRIGYTTARDNTVARTLRMTVSDGLDAVIATSQIRITPVNDAPTIAPTTTFTGQAARRRLVITHEMLVAASGARDTEGSPLTFRALSVQAGKLEKWDGRVWAPMLVDADAARIGFAPPPMIRPGERIRWTPPAAATGLTPAFTIRVNDGVLPSGTSLVSIVVGG